ncbi:agmatine deiminase family protein [Bacteroides acidifaciens]|mgnify:CR=1 FL=1|uniref:agmatine deiminase family protein n=1 Tax=Bacteroides acidifaciens TaxID=85831 RepID=UPI000F4A4520|nr:agmatine deiminase family protein [Bacteroides acidifaciens]ROS87511.1 peptidyl-arginine deiminase [Muribaculaceae bacterium Isolate-080 (Janvier)]
MSEIDKLKELMTLNANMNTLEIESRFEHIAQILFSKFAVKKGGQIFLFKDIEFYFYNQNHKDIITHPRNSEALYWYVNDFGGIDINMSSNVGTNLTSDNKEKYTLSDNDYFGGILIRQLIDKDNRKVINGPWACAELFRCHNAVGYDKDFPIIVEYDNGVVAVKRTTRINLLSTNQTVEKKVDNILSLYYKHPTSKDLYEAFTEFIKKPYRYVRFNELIHDENTDTVYLSSWLEKCHHDFYNRLISIFQELDIKYELLKHTKDYWARDYMPAQLGEHEFLKYKYNPDYLINNKNKDDKYTITNVDNVLRGMGISCRRTELIIDGGNMVACGPYIVMTDKVFTENNQDKGDISFKIELETIIGHPVIIIPWTMHGDFDAEDTDKYGHADGFIKWCGDRRILMGNHGDEYPEEAAAIRRILERHGFVVTEMRFNDKVTNPCHELNWAYINFLQIGRNIIMPKFNIEEDVIACQYIQESFPNCKIKQIEMTDIAKEGGALHCISWNIRSNRPN